ncbi:MAG TPA: hypothetical protein PKI19_10910 [Elusimicrobiales bacterium]|nr:hypothetical protein [Elusimicrobiales bacterium]
MKIFPILATVFLNVLFVFSGYATETRKESFTFVPDTDTIKRSWQDFFKDSVYLNLSTTTRMEVVNKLFSDLIESDTTYMTWPVGLQEEAKKIFYTRAGFAPLDTKEEHTLSADRIVSYDNTESEKGRIEKEQRLGAAIVRSNNSKRPSPESETDKSVPKTEIPRSDIKKFTMPVGRSWFQTPLEELQNDPNFMGYVIIMKSRKY